MEVTPPEMCVYLEIFNYTGDPYDVSAELWRRSTKVVEYYNELILLTRRDRDEVVLRLPLQGIEPKTYSLRILLNQALAGTIYLDFGHPEAAI